MEINDRLFESHLHCKYKAHLKSLGEVGIQSEYEKLQNEAKIKYAEKVLKDILSENKAEKLLSNQELTPPTLREGKKFLTHFSVQADELCATCDVLERLPGKSNLGIFHYSPTLSTPKERISKEDKLKLAFQALAIGTLQGRLPEFGRIIYGKKLKNIKVPLTEQIGVTQKLIAELRESLKGSSFKLVLNSHCRVCEFRNSCRAKAVEKDDLSLLTGLSEKDIKKFNSRGIFTITQYSYTFRPRRKRKGAKNQRRPHFFELKALAIRESKIYIYEKPELPTTSIRIYLDIEGDPEREFNYLIGILITDNKSEGKSYSFWAENEDDEQVIFGQFLSIIGTYPDFHLFYYGSYETKFLKRMRQKRDDKFEALLDKILKNATNILSMVYSNVYFPTYSNGLEDIARYLGFNWTDGNASGLQSIVWRAEWEKTRDERMKQKLIRYNLDDCLALKRITEFIYTVSSNDNTGPAGGETSPVIRVEDLRSGTRDRFTGGRRWGTTKFSSPDLDYINRCAYFDYQREKVYIRTNKNILKTTVKAKKRRKLYGRINKCIELNAPSKCFLCGCPKLMKADIFSRIVIDLRFFRGGMKTWVTKYLIRRYRCVVCNKFNTPRQYKTIRSKYGHGLISWIVYEHMANGLSGGQIERTLTDTFALPVSKNALSAQFRPSMAEYYKKTYYKLLKKIIAGNVIFADETKINMRDGSGYVWTFVSMEEIFYLFTETREGDFLKQLLETFKGVLVSDFYAAYVSINCAQQKCLIHLIRDLNDDFFKNQLDDEFKELVQHFTMVLRRIIDTIDKKGLKKRYLNKHRQDVKNIL